MATPNRFELSTSCVTGRRSNQLNYEAKAEFLLLPRGLVAAATVFIIARRPLIVNTFFKLFLFFLFLPCFIRCAAFYFLNFMGQNACFLLDFAQTAPKMTKNISGICLFGPQKFSAFCVCRPHRPRRAKSFCKNKTGRFF